jgi:hypothetical protein
MHAPAACGDQGFTIESAYLAAQGLIINPSATVAPTDFATRRMTFLGFPLPFFALFSWVSAFPFSYSCLRGK